MQLARSWNCLTALKELDLRRTLAAHATHLRHPMVALLRMPTVVEPLLATERLEHRIGLSRLHITVEQLDEKLVTGQIRILFEPFDQECLAERTQ
jgi:hypothetical protein